jgi:hypothetical protein
VNREELPAAAPKPSIVRWALLQGHETRDGFVAFSIPPVVCFRAILATPPAAFGNRAGLSVAVVAVLGCAAM